MPAEAAADSWIDMSAVRDKETREEFVSLVPGEVDARGVCLWWNERNL